MISCETGAVAGGWPVRARLWAALWLWPALIRASPGDTLVRGEFDLIADFKRHPLFVELWPHYQLGADCDRYHVHTRRD